ncbi:MAG: indole-3-glycerol-phosphate synthase [Planctomycetota bacterium]|nr:indole-3-glycerol-phosphate synthase [Planctomycetota bacterium]
MSFLEEIATATRARLADLPSGNPVKGRAGRLIEALRGRESLSVIAEVKRRSPSRGELAPFADAVAQARRYQEGGASAISVLTEPSRFGGSLDDLQAVAAAVDVPVLMKDFLIDPEQVRVGALLGASACLLIVRMLSGGQLDEMLAACSDHGLDALVECHDVDEVDRAVRSRAVVLGINNRDLDTLEVDTRRASELLPRVPASAVAVAESGYLLPTDTHRLRGECDAVLIGSALMSTDTPEAFLAEVMV